MKSIFILCDLTIYFRKEKIMFTGDFIFKGTIGRVDLPGGNYTDMINSLNKMKKYDKDILQQAIVYDDIYKQNNRKNCALLPYKGIKKAILKYRK